jgi:hypothetical protein
VSEATRPHRNLHSALIGCTNPGNVSDGEYNAESKDVMEWGEEAQKGSLGFGRKRVHIPPQTHYRGLQAESKA